jgi:bla regulator protein blaR1
MTTAILTQWLPPGFVKALSWMLIHSLWQGLALAIIGGIMIQCTKRSSAVVRYTFLLALFISFIAATVITFFVQYNSDGATTASHITTVVSAQTNLAQLQSAPVQLQSSNIDFTHTAIAYVNSYAQYIVLLWLCIFTIQCIKLTGGLYHIHRLRNRYTEPAPIDWEERFNHLCNRLGIQQSVALLQSGWVQVPVMLGSFKPVILVPLGMFTQIPTDQVEAVLIHELAHIRRKDYLVNLLQSFAEAVFFFNPGLRWLSSKMRQEREACCDDWVVAHTAQKTTYVEALVSFQEGLHNNRQYALALAGHKMHLLSRVKRMLTYENNKLNTMEKIFLLSGLVIFSAYGILR